MTTLDPTDDELERIERLRAELSDAHAGPYAAVETEHVLGYLLDLADAVDDPDRQADPTAVGRAGETGDGDVDEDDAHGEDAHGDAAFPRERLRTRLEERNRKHADPDGEPRMDLYTIAAEYDVAGRSEMTKDELVEAILDAAECLYEDPFAPVDVEFGQPDAGEESPEEPVGKPEDSDDTEDVDEADGEDGGSGQLNAMLSLLDTHDDKWHEADGDARYEVDLPDGTTETARTKDDVRALLFKNY